MPERRDLALQARAGRTRLVAEQHFAMSAGQLADEAPHRLWRVVDLAEEADLALAALLGQGDRDLQLGGIQTDKHFASLRHGSSLVREARRRPIRNNPRSSQSGDESPPPATNIRSVRPWSRSRSPRAKCPSRSPCACFYPRPGPTTPNACSARACRRHARPSAPSLRSRWLNSSAPSSPV